jgi:hypothetical protein
MSSAFPAGQMRGPGRAIGEILAQRADVDPVYRSLAEPRGRLLAEQPVGAEHDQRRGLADLPGASDDRLGLQGASVQNVRGEVARAVVG